MANLDRRSLDALEALLGLPVPRGYTDFLRAFPPELARATCDEFARRIADRDLFDDLARVVEENHGVRKYPMWGDDGASDWPAPHLVIGADPGGDVIFVDATRNDLVIHRYFVESCGTIRIADDLHSYARMLLRQDGHGARPARTRWEPIGLHGVSHRGAAG